MSTPRFNVYDKNGKQIISISSSLAKILGYHYVDSQHSSLQDDRLKLGLPWCAIIEQANTSRTPCLPEFSFNQNTGTISWIYNTALWNMPNNTIINGDAINVLIVYGVR